MRLIYSRRTILALVTLVLGCQMAVACASVPKKEQATTVLQAVHQTLADLQSSEITLFESGLVPSLTEARHREFHGKLADAFKFEQQAATVLLTWRAGDPTPTGLRELRSVIGEIVELIGGFNPSGEAATVIAYARVVLSQVGIFLELTEGGE